MDYLSVVFSLQSEWWKAAFVWSTGALTSLNVMVYFIGVVCWHDVKMLDKFVFPLWTLFGMGIMLSWLWLIVMTALLIVSIVGSIGDKRQSPNTPRTKLVLQYMTNAF